MRFHTSRAAVIAVAAFLLSVAPASAALSPGEEQARAVVKPLGAVKEALRGKENEVRAIGRWGQRQSDCIEGAFDASPPPVESSNSVSRVAATLFIGEVGRRLADLARRDWARAVRVWDELKTSDPQVKQVRKKAGTYIGLVLGVQRYKPCQQFQAWAEKDYRERALPPASGVSQAMKRAQEALLRALEEGQAFFRCEDGYLMLSLTVRSC